MANVCFLNGTLTVSNGKYDHKFSIDKLSIRLPLLARYLKWLLVQHKSTLQLAVYRVQRDSSSDKKVEILWL